MRRKKKKDEYLLKSEVQLLIQNYIRNIQMNDYGNDDGIPQLYAVMKQIDNLPTVDIVKGNEKEALDLVNQQKAEIERLSIECETLVTQLKVAYEQIHKLNMAKSEAIKEVVEKITEVFRRYAHLHTHAKGARTDCIETFDLTEIEMQSVWDVLTLKKNDMAEYEEMGRLQKNIEIIAMERLLNELEEDFRLLVKEMTEENK